MLDVFLNVSLLFCKKVLSKRLKPHGSSIWLKQSRALGLIGSVALRKPDPWDLRWGYPGGKFDAILTWKLSSLSPECFWCLEQGAALSVGRMHKGAYLPFLLSSVFASASFLFLSHRKSEPLLCSRIDIVLCIPIYF